MSNRITIDRVDQIMRMIFEQLKRMGGRAKGTEVLAAIAPQLQLTEHEKSTTKTGAVRWDTNIRFYTTDCVKAGYITKSDGYWALTEIGEQALKLPAGQLIRSAQRKYAEWRKSQQDEAPVEETDEIQELTPAESTKAERQAVFEKAIEDSRTEIEQHIDKLGPYDFQRLVAGLLNGMGYSTPFISPPGADGGVDIVAYKDPLGTTPPRIKVQAKHRDSKVAAKDVRELEGLLRKDGDIGLIVSSGGFTSEAVREMRASTKHIEAMDLGQLISLWQEHYERLSESGKALMPLTKVYFLSPPEQ